MDTYMFSTTEEYFVTGFCMWLIFGIDTGFYRSRIWQIDHGTNYHTPKCVQAWQLASLPAAKPEASSSREMLQTSSQVWLDTYLTCSWTVAHIIPPARLDKKQSRLIFQKDGWGISLLTATNAYSWEIETSRYWSLLFEPPKQCRR